MDPHLDPQLDDFYIHEHTGEYSLNTLRRFLTEQALAARAFRRFSILPYLVLCKLSYDSPDIRNENMQQYRSFNFEFFIHNELKRFAVTTPTLPNTLILVFRGTVLSDAEDRASDGPLLMGERRMGPFSADPRVGRELAAATQLGRMFLAEKAEQGHTGRVVLTGHSLGGRIAYEITKAHPEYDVVTFNMGSHANRVIREEIAPQQQRPGVGLHIKAHDDRLSGNVGDDGSDRNVVVQVRLPPSSSKLTPYHGVKLLLSYSYQIDDAVRRRLGDQVRIQQGGKRKRLMQAKTRRSIAKARKARKSRKVSSISKRKKSRTSVRAQK